MSFRIERWAGQPGVAEQLAAWHVREWQNVFPDWTEQIATQEFIAQLENSELPATWLAFDGDKLIGSISALLHDATELNDIPGPWLASFYIEPQYRGQGASQLLLDAAKQSVKNIGYKKWYLFTPHHETFYAKHDWQTIEYRQLHDELVVVMQQSLSKKRPE
jgi:GNAT superfamily N-acetyltransferase